MKGKKNNQAIFYYIYKIPILRLKFTIHICESSRRLSIQIGGLHRKKFIRKHSFFFRYLYGSEKIK